jgi:ubiquinone/menaquinone biosynthesis C-methylase UbiE
MKSTEEESFHDSWAEAIQPSELLPDESFLAATAPENRFILEKIGDLRGKKILDVGCGPGESSVFFAKRGAEVTGLDISGKMLETLKQLAALHGVEKKIKRIKASLGEQLPFADNSFHLVYGNGVIHHLPDSTLALREIKRVLKDKGAAAFIEPLTHNPLIKVYRLIATRVRTRGEKPLSVARIESLIGEFGPGEHREFQLTTLLVFLWFFLGKRMNPNRVRYWKEIVKESKRYERIFRLFFKLDDLLLRWIPYLRRFCWNSVIILEKNREDGQ